MKYLGDPGANATACVINLVACLVFAYLYGRATGRLHSGMRNSHGRLLLNGSGLRQFVECLCRDSRRDLVLLCAHPEYH